MFSPVDLATELSKKYEYCISSLNGLLHEYLDSPNVMSKKELSKFQLKAMNIANHSYTEMISALKATTEQVSREARLRAYSDARNKAPNIVVVSADISTVEMIIKQHFKNAAIAGANMAKKLMSRIAYLVSKGTSVESARIKVRESNRGQILSVYSTNKAGSKNRSQWAVYLRLTSFLTQTAHSEYISQSMKFGLDEFVIVQPENMRDGVRFKGEAFPTKELHPQSRAYVRIAEVNHVHS